jgi:short-chain fatty acids transporter
VVRRLGEVFTSLAHRFMPHPFVFALLLTLVTFLLGLGWARRGPVELLDAWVDGMFTAPLLVFALQMALILVTGHALAETRPVRRFLEGAAGLARGTASAAAVTALVAMLAGLLNWGLGLIVGALLARAVARGAAARGIRVHYPLVVAAGYTGLLVWHGGLSGSAPVSVATPGHPLEAATGLVPVTETLLSPMNLAVTGFLLLAVPVFLALMAPRAGDPVETAPPLADAPEAGDDPRTTPAGRLENSRVLAAVMALLALAWLVPRFVDLGWRAVDLNTMILLFLALGLLLHGTPRRYAASIDEAAAGAGGILLQFPFYFGIMGLMRGAGLIERMADLFVSWTGALGALGLSPGAAYGMLTVVSAGLVNLFVPSGGGQWAVQGPIAVAAAEALGLDLPRIVMALAYGDQLTNMLQPFWALPLLAVTGLKARQIVGYTGLLLLLVAPGVLVLTALFSA